MMNDSTFDSVKLAEGIRLVLRGLGLVLTEMGEYTTRVSNTTVPTEDTPAEVPETPAEVHSTESGKTPATVSKAGSAGTPAVTHAQKTETPEKDGTPSVDDITKLIVQKLKKNGSLNEEIQKVVKSFGVATVKDIPEERRADFVEQLKKL